MENGNDLSDATLAVHPRSAPHSPLNSCHHLIVAAMDVAHHKIHGAHYLSYLVLVVFKRPKWENSEIF
jgi:hypothetical protein